jgi:hypothetical protein
MVKAQDFMKLLLERQPIFKNIELSPIKRTFSRYKKTEFKTKYGIISAVDKNEYFKAVLKEKNKWNIEIIGDYIDINTKIKCIFEEEVIYRSPGSLLSGSKPRVTPKPKVLKKPRLTRDEYITVCNIIHNHKYEYPNTPPINGKIPIICPRHGLFYQGPSNHKAKHGCMMCRNEAISNKKRKSLVDFIKEASTLHDHKYIYDKCIYVRANIKLIITCPIHGDFLTKPSCHTNGQGCPTCAMIIRNCAYSGMTNRDAELIECKFYVLEFSGKEERFYKIGISKNIDKRWSSKKLMYSIRTILLRNLTLFKAITLEQKILKELKNYSYTPNIYFKGQTECLTLNSIDKIKIIINEFDTTERR